MLDGQTTDAVLMREVASGRRESLEVLIRRHGCDVLTFIARTINQSHRRDDVFQDVFLAVWKNRFQYQYPRPFKPWLLKITANKCREHLRSGKQRAWSLTDDPLSAADQPDASLISRETSDVIASSVARLPQNQRTVVVMRIWNGLSYAEIAQATGSSEGTVRSRMHHALNRLRQKLQTRLQ